MKTDVPVGQARWLTVNERDWINSRLEEERRAKAHGDQVTIWRALRNPAVLILTAALSSAAVLRAWDVVSADVGRQRDVLLGGRPHESRTERQPPHLRRAEVLDDFRAGIARRAPVENSLRVGEQEFEAWLPRPDLSPPDTPECYTRSRLSEPAKWSGLDERRERSA